MDEAEPFDAPVRAMPEEDERLTVTLGGWEGPLDLLLDLARSQKVDLAQISILALVDQYLDYVRHARSLRLELAADYLVMAAWLTYLKSALLLPKEAQEEPSAEELALRLQLQLQRLDAMRDAAARLMARDRLGRDIFARGAPEGLRVVQSSRIDCSLYELLKGYGDIRARTAPRFYAVSRRPVLSLDEALERLEALLGVSVEWTEIAAFLPGSDDRDYARSTLASTFVAALELAKQGRAELAQAETFGPLRLRRRP